MKLIAGRVSIFLVVGMFCVTTAGSAGSAGPTGQCSSEFSLPMKETNNPPAVSEEQIQRWRSLLEKWVTNPQLVLKELIPKVARETRYFPASFPSREATSALGPVGARRISWQDLFTHVERLRGEGSTNNYGIYKVHTQVGSIENQQIFKIALANDIFGLWDHWEKPGENDLHRADFWPLKQSELGGARYKDELSDQRRGALGIVLNHFLYVVGQELKYPLVPQLHAVLPRSTIQQLLVETASPLLMLPGEDRSSFLQLSAVPESQQPTVGKARELQAVYWGLLMEKLSIEKDVRDPTQNLSAKAPQVAFLVELLNRLGIELGDPNPVVVKGGRVMLIDLEGAMVVLSDGSVVDGIANPITREGGRARLAQTGVTNRTLRDRAEPQ